MRRILLIAQGTIDRPVADILSIAASAAITFVAGIAILSMNWPLSVTLTALVALLVLVALAKARFRGPRELRIEKPADGGPLGISGRFTDGEIPVGRTRELASLSLEGGTLRFTTRDENGDASVRIDQPAFSTESLATLRDTIEAMRDMDENDVLRHFRTGVEGLKLYDAKKLVLLQFTQKPSYMAILWVTSGVTILSLFLVILIVVSL